MHKKSTGERWPYFEYALLMMMMTTTTKGIHIDDLPDKHVNSGDGHVSVDRLPRFSESVQLSVGQRTAIVDLQASLQVTASDLFHRRLAVATFSAAETHRCRNGGSRGAPWPVASGDRLTADTGNTSSVKGTASLGAARRRSFSTFTAVAASHLLSSSENQRVTLVWLLVLYLLRSDWMKCWFCAWKLPQMRCLFR